MVQKKAHGRPDISVFENDDENGYEVHIQGEHGLSANVKIGYDNMDADGDPIVILDAMKDEDAEGVVQQGGAGGDYAYFRLVGGDDEE